MTPDELKLLHDYCQSNHGTASQIKKATGVKASREEVLDALELMASEGCIKALTTTRQYGQYSLLGYNPEVKLRDTGSR